VICPTAHPGPLVAAIMASVRESVDEIVIAADARVGAEDLGWYVTVADKLVRFEHIGANRHYGWLVEQASGDWLLLLDGDELPGAGLVTALPALAADRRIAQYSAPIHWPWREIGERLDDEPWRSDRRLRLIRNDGRTAFHGRKHALAFDDFPQRHLGDEMPVYHLDLLLNDQEQRAAKAARYDGEAFGVMTPDGRPFNSAFYVPEQRDPTPTTAPLPALDRERIAAALARLTTPGTAPPPLDPATVPLADRDEVGRHWAFTTLQQSDYAGAVTIEQPLPPFTAGAKDHVVWVRVRNDGAARWRWGLERPPLIRLGVRWRTADGTMIDTPNRSPLPCTVEPGGDELVAVSVLAPPAAGEYELIVDAIHENVRWFEIGVPVPVHVEPSVAEQLDALQERTGPIAPLGDVRKLRAAVGRRDALVNDLVSGPPRTSAQLEPALRALIGDMAIGAWALDETTLSELATIVRRERPEAILELGSGTSTVLLSALLRELHGDQARDRLVTLEQDSHWANVTRDALVRRGLAHVASVHCVPVGPPRDGVPACYLPTQHAIASLRAAAPQLVLVDGPTLDSGASRVGAVELARPYVRDNALLLLDDALRDAELLVAEAWSQRDDVVVDGIKLIGKGLLIGRFSAPPSAVPPQRRGLLGRLRWNGLSLMAQRAV
jgi:predicted O-methyltransferase YrrM